MSEDYRTKADEVGCRTIWEHDEAYISYRARLEEVSSEILALHAMKYHVPYYIMDLDREVSISMARAILHHYGEKLGLSKRCTTRSTAPTPTTATQP